MDYIVSGGLGFIGKNLSMKLSHYDKKYLVLDLLNGYDICNGSMTNCPDCRTFVHLAAVTSVRESLKYPATTIKSNIVGLLNCLNFTRYTGCKLIFSSSAGAPCSVSPYSASKLAGEAICNSFREAYGCEIVILRLSNVYGPHSELKNSVIAKFIRNCYSHQPLTIFGDGLQTRDFIHVDDVCNVIVSEPEAHLLNISSGKPVKVLDIAEMIREISYKELNFRPDIKWKPQIRGEITKVDSITSIKPKVLLEKGIESTFKWFGAFYAATK